MTGPPAIDTGDLGGSKVTTANSFPVESFPDGEGELSSFSSKRICEKEEDASTMVINQLP
jgi:hypothetical protein